MSVFGTVFGQVFGSVFGSVGGGAPPFLSVTVRAYKAGWFGEVYRDIGATFVITNPLEYSPYWMTFVDTVPPSWEPYLAVFSEYIDREILDF